MERLSRRQILIAVLWALSLVCASLSTYYYASGSFPWSWGGQAAEAGDVVFFIVETPEGKATLATHNVITDIGEMRLRNMTSQGGTSYANAVKWISIGNATASKTLTQLTVEYDRQQGTVTEWINNGDYAYNLTRKWTFTETVTLDCAGAHWDSAGDGNLFAVANFPFGSQTFHANWNLTVIWIITFDAN